MPDLHAILAFYAAFARFAVTGALDNECFLATRGELTHVARQFLTGHERSGWPELAPAAQAARLRKGEQRFRQWERANPDLVAVLKRRAGEAGIA